MRRVRFSVAMSLDGTNGTQATDESYRSHVFNRIPHQ